MLISGSKTPGGAIQHVLLSLHDACASQPWGDLDAALCGAPRHKHVEDVLVEHLGEFSGFFNPHAAQ